MNNLLKSQKTYVIMLVLFTGVIMFYRNYFREPLGDELIYEYVWEKGDNKGQREDGHRYERRVTGFDDILQTQIIHYRITNGRSLIHAAEQAFTDHHLSFSIINALVFILMASLLVRYGGWLFSYPLWFFTLICLIFLFPVPNGLWVSVNLSPNYLWPCTMSVGFFLLWDYMGNKILPWFWYPLIVIFAFVLGWSHEGFALPITGCFFLYYFLNFKEFKKRLLWLGIPLLIGTILCTFSPGNLNRASGKPLLLSIHDGIANIFYLKIFWLLVIWIIMVLIFDGKKNLLVFIGENIKIAYAFVLSFAFALVANTGPWTNTFMELMSLILILRYLAEKGFFIKKWVKVCAAILTFIFVPQQIILANDCVKLYKFQHRVCAEYITSPDGYVRLDESKYFPSSVDFLPIIPCSFDMERSKVHNIYHRGDTIPLFFHRADYLAIESPDSFYIPNNRIPGSAPVYYLPGGEYYWVHPDSISFAQNLTANLKPVGWDHDAIFIMKLKYALFPGGYPDTETLQIDTVHTRFGDKYRIKKLKVRKIKNIDSYAYSRQ